MSSTAVLSLKAYDGETIQVVYDDYGHQYARRVSKDKSNATKWVSSDAEISRLLHSSVKSKDYSTPNERVTEIESDVKNTTDLLSEVSLKTDHLYDQLKGSLTGLKINGIVTSPDQLPSDSSNGDVYLVNDLIYIRSAGKWIEGGSYRGPQGDQGLPGPGLNIRGSVPSVNDLPSSGQNGYAYFVGSTMYAWTDNKWISVGDIAPDLSNYPTTDLMNKSIDEKITNYDSTSFHESDTANYQKRKITTDNGQPLTVINSGDDLNSKIKSLSSSAGFGTISISGSSVGNKYSTDLSGTFISDGNTVIISAVTPTLDSVRIKGTSTGDNPAWESNHSDLVNKVIDNHDGTIQVNGTQVSPYNKLADTIGGRNLLLNTGNPGSGRDVKLLGAKSIEKTGNLAWQDGWVNITATGAESYYRFNNPNDATMYYKPGQTYTLIGMTKASVAGTLALVPQVSVNGASGWTEYGETKAIAMDVQSRAFIFKFTVPSKAVNFFVGLEGYGTGSNGSDTNYMAKGETWGFKLAALYEGDCNPVWTPAPEDKVNISDMRKPANQVASIDEVNAKQDKIGYTPADDSKVVHNSAIDPSVLVKNTLTADDDVFTLDAGTYLVWNIAPKNYPTNLVPWGLVTIKTFLHDGNKIVEASDTNNIQMINIYAGLPAAWKGWQVPNSNIMATKSDITTAISTATANMVDSTKATNFTAGLQSGGVDVATAADLKSIEDKAWRRLDFGPDANLGGALVSSYIVYQIHADEKYLSFFFLGIPQSVTKTFSDNTILMDLSSIVKGISSIDFSTSYSEISDNYNTPASFKISGTNIITSTSNHEIYVSSDSIVSLSSLNHSDRRIYYTELV